MLDMGFEPQIRKILMQIPRPKSESISKVCAASGLEVSQLEGFHAASQRVGTRSQASLN